MESQRNKKATQEREQSAGQQQRAVSYPNTPLAWFLNKHSLAQWDSDDSFPTDAHGSGKTHKQGTI